MSIVALITWITAAAGGLYLLSIWLIEYDRDFQAAAATRLPPLVLAGHVLFAGGGLVIWASYLIVDANNLAWAAVAALVAAATLGTTMAVRWVGVYRDTRELRRSASQQGAWPPALTDGTGPGRSAIASGPGQVGTLDRSIHIGPPERNFPLPVVIGHGLFAATTVALVLLTALGVGRG